MVTRVIQPSSDRPIIKDEGSPSVQFNSWLNLITGRALIISTGNPEGVVEAKQGAIYMDDAGTTGSIFYVKRDADISGDKTKGWILV